jgi:RNA 2',3'-cyclic 3'-phosphodiesterase
MRTFIAVELPDDIRERIGTYIEAIEAGISGVKWVAPENLHLTIKFLGEIEPADVERLSHCVEQVAKECRSFTMGLSGIGFFPTEKHPKVIWIGADGGEDALLDLYQEMERCLEDIGYDREAKTFSPHLTIGRVKRDKKITIPGNLTDFEQVSFRVETIAIMKSTLTPEGPIYEKLSECMLGPEEVFDLEL